LDARCFEIFGFDVFVDENLKPWLLEVNRAPAMAVTTPQDSAVKTPMLQDAFQMLDLERRLLPGKVTASFSAATTAAGALSESKLSTGDWECVWPIEGQTDAVSESQDGVTIPLSAEALHKWKQAVVSSVSTKDEEDPRCDEPRDTPVEQPPESRKSTRVLRPRRKLGTKGGTRSVCLSNHARKAHAEDPTGVSREVLQ